eukprot:TRINITY_DN13365_c0_g1_i1.p1 TRINITY_DN13365_c0_g1~~TRINITY_DN13365_c0_g1_i1.p1  ORF type:complete len:603 (-),score=178.05 TRINITY_DN13365_c0_g1_i1:112-1920(-)
MHRRSTLGPVSAASLNARSRPSIGGIKDRRTTLGAAPARLSEGGRKSSITGRRSSIARRSSVMPRAAPVKLSDPREITTKAFMQQAQRNIITFLTERGFNQPIGPKSLTSPSLNEFKNLFAFLIQKIDPGFTWTVGKKFEDDVICWCKQIKYPFSISKASLQAVGSLHTWPALLACLSWIVELLLFEEESRNAQTTPYDMLDESTRLLFDYLQAAYATFMQTAETSELEAKLAEEFSKRNKATIAEISEYSEKNAAMQLEYSQLTANEAPVVVLRKQVQTLEGDRDRYKEYNDNVTVHVEKTDEKIMLLKENLEEALLEQQEISAETARLKAIVENQELSAADVQRMQHDREHLSGQLKATSKQREGAEQTLMQSEIAVTKKLQDVERTLSQYNQLATNNQLLPISAKNSGGFDYEVVLNIHAKQTDDLLSKDLKTVIRPQLQKFKDLIYKKTQQAVEEELTMQEKVQRAQDAFTEKQDQLNATNAKLKKLEARCLVEKSESDEVIKTLTAQTEELELRMQQSRVVNSASVADSEAEIRSAVAEYEMAVALIAREREAASKTMMHAAQMVTEHKASVNARLAALQATAENVLTQVKSLVPAQ